MRQTIYRSSGPAGPSSPITFLLAALSTAHAMMAALERLLAPRQAQSVDMTGGLERHFQEATLSAVQEVSYERRRRKWSKLKTENEAGSLKMESRHAWALNAIPLANLKALADLGASARVRAFARAGGS